MSESNLYFLPRLYASESFPDEDLIGVAHPRGGINDLRAMSLTELSKAIGGGTDGGGTEPLEELLIMGSRDGMRLSSAGVGEVPTIQAEGPGDHVSLGVRAQGYGAVYFGPGRFPSGDVIHFGLDFTSMDPANVGLNFMAIDVLVYGKDNGSIYGGLFNSYGDAASVLGDAWIHGVGAQAWSQAPVGVVDAKTIGCEAKAGLYNGGACNLVAGMQAFMNSYYGNVVDGYGVLITSGACYSGGTITNNYGLRIEDQLAGAANWALKTGLGKVEFGDAVDAPSYKVGGVAGANFTGLPASLTIVNGIVTAAA